jgi:hypothetical protein
MDYGQIYSDLIERGLTRTLGDDVYLEKHHVWPKCMGGPDEASNIVKLTAEEHFLAHQLLVKMFPDNYKLAYAANMMCVSPKGNKQRSTNKRYGWLRKKMQTRQSPEHIAKRSAALKGRVSGMTGKKHSEETRCKMSKAAKGKPKSEKQRIKNSELKKGNKNMLGKKHSEESRLKMSEAHKNISEETRRKISEAAKRRKHSPETIAKREATKKANREAKLLKIY